MASRAGATYTEAIMAVTCEKSHCKSGPRRRCKTPGGRDTPPHDCRVQAAAVLAQNNEKRSDK